MKKLITTGIVWLFILGSYAYVYKLGGDNRENALLADQAGKLVKSTQQIVDVFHTLSQQTAELNAVKENPPAGPNVRRSVDILRRAEASEGPYSPPKPTRGASD